MTSKTRKILVLASHPDDELLGCGGTIAKQIAERSAVVQCVFLMVAPGARHKPGTEAFKRDTERREGEAIKVSKELGCLPPIFLNFPSIRITREIYPDLSQAIEKIINEFLPNVIYTHNASDNNFDHRIAFEATMTACRPRKGMGVEEILSYEIPSATEDYNEGLGKPFVPDVFVNIEKYAGEKRAMLQLYSEEMREYPYARSLDAVDNLAKYRGSTVNETRCEAFRLIRRIDR